MVCLLILYGLFAAFSRVWTEHLWYAEVGYTNVLWTPWLARFLVGLFFAVVFFAIFYGSLWAARRLTRRLLGGSQAAPAEFFETRRRRWPALLLLAGALVAALIIGIIYGGRWEQVLLFLQRTDFGYVDPIFGKDASFFVFTLPVWRTLVDFVGLSLFFTLIATASVYAADRAFVLTNTQKVRLAPHVKAHLSVLVALLLVAKAGDYLLQTWSLAYSERGVVFGASYADVHASLPVLRFLAVISLVAAAIFLVNVRNKGWRLPAIALLVMVLAWAIGGKAYPALVQQYKVAPNEIQAESPYISNNIQATRFAFGLAEIAHIPFAARTGLTADLVRANAVTLKSVRLWEPRPALSTYSQIQAIRLYYSFTDVDVDRYYVNGEYRQVLISARELDQSRLQPQSRTWINEHLVYTHGYGLVVSPVNEAAGDGLPVLWLKDIPPRGQTDLQITRPEVYYGELGNEYVVVGTKTPEFDYPVSEGNEYSAYQGKGGVELSNFLRRLAYGLRFGTAKLLMSDSITKNSRIMYRRTVMERAKALAPFLSYDPDPYPVIRKDGSLCWVMDAYTTSGRFPQSQPSDRGFNYIRNAVKVVVDAYDGKVTFYQVDAQDPIATAWGNIFPGLFTPGEQMPQDLRAHLRYPEEMFDTQAAMLRLYHMTDATLFYNKEDAWDIPTEIYAREQVPVVPYYEMLALPGSKEPEFALLIPFTPLGKENMTSLLVARQDGEHYGELLLLDLPRDSLVFGPAQIEARITNQPDISAQLTLWDQAGSQVIRGNLLVVPIGDSLMYFEPLYLQAEKSSIPELARVIVAHGDQVVMAPTLDEALSQLVGEPIALSGPAAGAYQPDGSPPAVGPVLPTDPAALLALAERLYADALEAQRTGDRTRYEEATRELGRVLTALTAALQSQP